MKKILIASALAAALISPATASGRSSTLIRNWEFSKDSTRWENVTIPQDWAIYGPFSRDNDLQRVAVEQNGEKEETLKTGRTGGLPFIGKGYYKTTFEVPDTAGRAYSLVFDGAMSNGSLRRRPHGQ